MLRGGGLLYLTTLFVAKIIHVIGGSQMKYEYVALMEWHWDNPKYWERNPTITNFTWTGLGSNPCLRGETPNTNRLGRRTAHLKADIWSCDNRQNIDSDIGVMPPWFWTFRRNLRAPYLRQILHEVTDILILYFSLCWRETIKLIRLIPRNPNFLN